MGQAVTTLEQLCEFFDIRLGPRTAWPFTIPNSNRQRLAEFFAYAGFKNIAEIGVESGRYAHDLLSVNPGLHLYLVDAWQSYGDYRQHVSVERTEWMLTRTRERLKGFHYTIVRKFSVEAAAQIQNGSLDAVYIDANHAYEYVVQDIAAWLPKVRSGGIIAGHDYAHGALSGMPCGVIEAVNGWTQAYHVKPWFLVGQLGIAPGDHRQRPQSWLWVKE